MITSEILAVFAKGGFSPRAKGQRYDPDYLPLILGSDGSNPVPAPHELQGSLKVEQLGSFVACWGSSANHPRMVIAYSVTLPCGTRVPAYSLGVNYNVCQAYNFLAVK